MSEFVVCPECSGTGWRFNWRCPVCDGGGTVLSTIEDRYLRRAGFHPLSARALRTRRPVLTPIALAPIRGTNPALDSSALDCDPRPEQIVDTQSEEIGDAIEIVETDTAFTGEDLAQPGATVTTVKREGFSGNPAIANEGADVLAQQVRSTERQRGGIVSETPTRVQEVVNEKLSS